MRQKNVVKEDLITQPNGIISHLVIKTQLCIVLLHISLPESYLVFFNRLAEMDFAVSQKLDPEVADNLEYQQPKRKGRARYVLAKKYFDVKEYSRLDV